MGSIGLLLHIQAHSVIIISWLLESVRLCPKVIPSTLLNIMKN
jgi:hypothetical protein